jgi:general stress protein YciG
MNAFIQDFLKRRGELPATNAAHTPQNMRQVSHKGGSKAMEIEEEPEVSGLNYIIEKKPGNKHVIAYLKTVRDNLMEDSDDE